MLKWFCSSNWLSLNMDWLTITRITIQFDPKEAIRHGRTFAFGSCCLSNSSITSGWRSMFVAPDLFQSSIIWTLSFEFFLTVSDNWISSKHFATISWMHPIIIFDGNYVRCLVCSLVREEVYIKGVYWWGGKIAWLMELVNGILIIHLEKTHTTCRITQRPVLARVSGITKGLKWYLMYKCLLLLDRSISPNKLCELFYYQ